MGESIKKNSYNSTMARVEADNDNKLESENGVEKTNLEMYSEVLDEYKKLYNSNKKLIGWLKIDDTNIDYPVMQTSDNEYYQNHNLNHTEGLLHLLLPASYL